MEMESKKLRGPGMFKPKKLKSRARLRRAVRALERQTNKEIEGLDFFAMY